MNIYLKNKTTQFIFSSRWIRREFGNTPGKKKNKIQTFSADLNILKQKKKKKKKIIFLLTNIGIGYRYRYRIVSVSERGCCIEISVSDENAVSDHPY